MPLPDADALADVVMHAIEMALAPVLLRLAVAEDRLKAIGDLRDRVVTFETKAAQPLPVDLHDVRDRLVRLETKADLIVGPPGDKGLDGRDGERGERGEAGAPGEPGPPGPAGERGPEGAAGRDGRDGMPGMPGEKGIDGLRGADGAPGLNGINGRDGSLEHLKAVFDGERTVTLCFKNGDPIEGGVLRFDVPLYRGVYVQGKGYEAADMVTWAGSTWLCLESTSTKPGESKAWQLCVKRGRDGKDGRDLSPAASVLPVVTVGKGR